MGQSGGHDEDGNELPRLVYVSREKRPGYNHHKKAGAMNALVNPISLYSFPLASWSKYHIENLGIAQKKLKVQYEIFRRILSCEVVTPEIISN